MKNRSVKVGSLGLLPLLSFVLLAACILTVLLAGAELYRRANERDEYEYHRRTAVQYVAMRVRQSCDEGAYYVGTFGDGTAAAEGDCLYYAEEISGKSYVTAVYCHGGSLRELFCDADAELPPSAGEVILPLEDLSFSISDGLLTASLDFGNGDTEQVVIALRPEAGDRYGDAAQP